MWVRALPPNCVRDVELVEVDFTPRLFAKRDQRTLRTPHPLGLKVEMQSERLLAQTAADLPKKPRLSDSPHSCDIDHTTRIIRRAADLEQSAHRLNAIDEATELRTARPEARSESHSRARKLTDSSIGSISRLAIRASSTEGLFRISPHMS